MICFLRSRYKRNKLRQQSIKEAFDKLDPDVIARRKEARFAKHCCEGLLWTFVKEEPIEDVPFDLHSRRYNFVRR